MSRLPPSARRRVRTGGRSEDVRRRVGDACLELLSAGAIDFGPVQVAQRAGVSRATLHRWWPTKDDLLREALTRHTQALVVPDTGSWAGDLRAFAHALAGFFADPVEVGQNALMASGAHPDYTVAVLEHYSPIFDEWKAMVERARARREVADDVDTDAVLLVALSPLLLVPLLYRATLTPADVDAIVDLVLRATDPGAGSSSDRRPAGTSRRR